MLTEAQFAERMRMITASDAAGICGISKYISPHHVYRRLVHGEVVEVDNEDIDRGNFLEPGCRKWYAKKTSTLYTEPPLHLKHPEHDFIGCLPDGIVSSKSGARSAPSNGLEIKNPGPFADGWGEPGTDNVPPEAFLQSVVGMACSGLPRWDVVAPMGGRLCIYPIHRDKKIEEDVIGKMVAFWRDHVQKKAEPPLSFAQSDSNWVHRRWKFNRDEYLQEKELTPAQREVVDLLYKVSAEADKWTKTKESAINQLKAVIGDKSGVMLDFGRIDWKLNKPKEVIDWPACVREALSLYAAERKAAPPTDDEISFFVANFTSFAPGSRPFTPRFK